MENMQNKESFIGNPSSTQEGFTKIYSDGNPPWEIGKPQPPFVEIADKVESPVLDSGCGTGNTSLFFSARGLKVTGIDFVEEAIRQARTKSAERGLTVEFLVMDAMKLSEWDKRFASVIDSGLFHIYSGDERKLYVKGLAHVLKPGGRLFLFSFSNKLPKEMGGVSESELNDIFSEGWDIESLQLVQGELNPAYEEEFSHWGLNGDPKMWFAIIRRKE
jgi:ubiquinone/menaquinone biosynthesis C-methylase UbiE